MNAANKKLEKTALIAISIAFLIWCAAFIFQISLIAMDGKRYFCLFDDAMISMRYAWNFSHGMGLVWNEGEYIQGYTNLLMVLLMSLATLLLDKPAAVLSIQALGAGLMALIAYISIQIADYIITPENSPHRALVKILSFFGILSYYPLAYWSLMGMETGLLTFLVLAGVLSAFRYIESKRPAHLLLASLFFGLAYLTRNDSAIIAFLVWAYIAWEIFAPASGNNRTGFLPLLAAICLYIAFILGLHVFQHLYYGEWLPNTYTLKLTGMALSDRLQNGIGFIIPFLVESAFILIVACAGVFLNFQKKKLLFLAIIFSAISYQVYIGGDAWSYWRMAIPAIPLLIVLFTVSVSNFTLAASRSQLLSAYLAGKKNITQALVILLVLTGLLLASVFYQPQIMLQKKPFQTEANKDNIKIALALDKLTAPNATVGVFWAGTIPYYTGRKAMDFLGKSDRYIAQLPPDTSGSISWDNMKSVPGHNKYDLNYSIKSLEPTYIERTKWGRQDLTEWVKTKYVKVRYNGATLILLKDSPLVFWDKINAPSPGQPTQSGTLPLHAAKPWIAYAEQAE